MKLINIKAIVFDAYGTLFDINSLDQILERYFGDEADRLSALWRRKQLEYTWLRTLMGRYKPFNEVTMDALAHGCNALELNFTDEIRQHLHEEYMRLKTYPEVDSVLMQLSKTISLGVLSNANKSMLQGALNRNNLGVLFEHVLSVEDLELYKPKPEVYQLACTSFKLESEQILFISANTWDASGAKSFGLQVAWLNRFDGTVEELDMEPDYVLDSIGQLLTIVGK